MGMAGGGLSMEKSILPAIVWRKTKTAGGIFEMEK